MGGGVRIVGLAKVAWSCSEPTCTPCVGAEVARLVCCAQASRTTRAQSVRGWVDIHAAEVEWLRGPCRCTWLVASRRHLVKH